MANTGAWATWGCMRSIFPSGSVGSRSACTPNCPRSLRNDRTAKEERRLAARGTTRPFSARSNSPIRARFPITFHTKRIAPGESNTWLIRVLGMKRSMAFSSKYPKTLQVMEYQPGGVQAWQHIDLGYQSAYPTITGGIFEFGFTDSILQMWAAFCGKYAREPACHLRI